MMKNYRLIKVLSLGLTSLFLISGCVTTGIPEEAVKLDEAGIIKYFSGKTAYGNFPRPREDWIEYYSEDGKAVYKYGGRILYGAWSIKTDSLCTRYVTSKDDDEYCWDLYKLGDGFVDTAASGRDKGKIAAKIEKVLDGDTEGFME